MKKKYFLLLLLVPFHFQAFTAAPDYIGSRLLQLIGLTADTRDFKPVKELWALDKNYESQTKGIKLSVNGITGKVESILIAGENFTASGSKFSRFNSSLPYRIQMRDDTAALRTKLGNGEKMMGRNALKYYQDKYAVEVSFTDARFKTINSVLFFKEAKPVTAQPEKPVTAPVAVSAVAKYQQEEKKIQAAKQSAVPTSVVKTIPVIASKTITKVENMSPFKRAMLDVFKAYRESNFATIKNGTRSIPNFWNYKFTYGTKEQIPGEKFNMLYSFPFAYSQLDFVSVLQEGEDSDKSFVTTYKDFEKKLMENFPAKDGWISSCIANKESKTLSDLEFRNDKYGAIVLDYSRSPQGKCILYLRFLFFSS